MELFERKISLTLDVSEAEGVFQLVQSLEPSVLDKNRYALNVATRALNQIQREYTALNMEIRALGFFKTYDPKGALQALSKKFDIPLKDLYFFAHVQPLQLECFIEQYQSRYADFTMELHTNSARKAFPAVRRLLVLSLLEHYRQRPNFEVVNPADTKDQELKISAAIGSSVD